MYSGVITMNKYQEALNNVKRVYIESDHYDEEDIRLLQELVDKATPKKPIEKELWHGGIASKCPECGYCLTNSMLPCDTQYKFCPDCGQKIDWEETE